MKDQVTNVLRLANLVRENIRVKQLFTLHNSILVTLSGGQDSLCSLLLLYLLQNQFGLDLHGRTKSIRTANSNFRFAEPPEGGFQVRKTRVGIAIHKAACSGRGTPLFGRTHPPAEYGQAERVSGVWAARPRQLNKSIRVARFTAIRGHISSDLGPGRKVGCVQPSITRDSWSNSRYAHLESPPWFCLAEPSVRQRSNFRFAKVYASSLLASPAQKQVFSEAKVRDRCLKKSSRFIVPERSSVGSPSANLEFGVLWCNHFWQRESFYTMLHVAKINLCFSSTMCFYLPIENILSEQNAREWRHKSIQRTCAFYHYDCCTQGHTKSDCVETILFNILRGTGIAGLQSLQWKKSFYSFSCQRFYP